MVHQRRRRRIDEMLESQVAYIGSSLARALKETGIPSHAPVPAEYVDVSFAARCRDSPSMPSSLIAQSPTAMFHHDPSLAAEMIHGENTTESGPRLQPAMPSHLGLLLQIEASRDRAAEPTGRLLFLVLHFDLGEVQRDRLDRNLLTVVSAGLIGAHQNVGELDLQVFLLVLAGLAAGQDSRS